ncbi:peptide chain release factor N(5)-glutamine methyltransferase [Spongiimicrobium sp. 3-5]|uniref:peptide chain release factor N(5)-glutamine methyltransferase n=1 Tax=Spongiimicrobium sp. 3-5 TaxID=3332596 RepID=UPI003980BA30
MLLKEIKNIFHKELDSLYQTEEVESFFHLMTSHYLGLERFVLALEPNLIVSKEEEQPLFEGLNALKLETPVQYILGKTYFYDLTFKVNKDVLIPRPETEELVRWILEDIEKKHNKTAAESIPVSERQYNLKILDIGTGSGCIAITLAKNLPGAKVVAMDISSEALQLAKENAINNAVEIRFIEADVLTAEPLNETFDIIVSNPPYVRLSEKRAMRKNVKDFEPEVALFVPNESPLLFYERITSLAAKKLSTSGILYFEINQYLGKETVALLEAQNFLEIELRKDIFGNDRMLKGVIG